MNWEAIGSTAEAVSVVLVLVSILYLAVQVRRNTNAVKGATPRSYRHIQCCVHTYRTE